MAEVLGLLLTDFAALNDARVNAAKTLVSLKGATAKTVETITSLK